MSSVSDSFWKPPVLKSEQFEWWKDQFEAHVCSLDGQLWRVIEKGPFPIMDLTDRTNPVEKDKDSYTEEDYTKVEKNARAKKVLYSALSLADQIKVSKHKTAKEMYDALVKIYEGSEDVKKNRILIALEDYDRIEQRHDESFEDFYTRFQSIVGHLAHLGHELPDWRITHQFLQSLTPKWDNITTAIRAQRDTKKISLEELVAELQSQSNLDEKKEARRNRDKPQEKQPQSTAFKTEDNPEAAQPLEGKHELALLAKEFPSISKRKLFKPCGGGRGNPSKDNKKGNKSSEDRICHHSRNKGHLMIDCRKKKRGNNLLKNHQ